MPKLTQQYANLSKPEPPATNATERNWRNMQSRGYWESPQRIARYYNVIRTAPPGWKAPDWLDTNAVNTAYAYMRERNGNKPWQEWDWLPESDAGSLYLRSLAAPPDNMLFPNEKNNLRFRNRWPEELRQLLPDKNRNLTDEQYALLRSGGILTPEQVQAQQPFGSWEDLEPWQQLALGLLSPQSGMEDRPEWTRITAALGQGALAGLGGAAAGGIFGGIGAPIGFLVVGGLSAYQAYTGKEVPVINEYLMLFNQAALAAEKTLGVSEQIGTEGWQKIIADLPNAWQAAALTYETGSVPLLGNVGTGILNTLARVAGDEAAGEGQVWRIEQGLSEPQQAGQALGPEALTRYRKMLAEGATMEDLYADAQQNYGFSGTVGDFVASSILDPLNLAPYAGNKLGAGVAKAVGNERLGKAFEMGAGNPIIDILPFGVQQLASKVTGISGSTGPLASFDMYKNWVRSGTFPEGTKPVMPEDLSAYEKRVAGLTPEGKIAEIQPRQPQPGKKSMATWMNYLTTLTDESRAHVFLNVLHDNVNAAMTLAEGNPARMVETLNKLVGRSEVGAGDPVNNLLASPAVSSIRDGLRAALDSGMADEMLATWVAGAERRTILVKIAQALKEEPAKVLEQLQSKPDVLMARLNDIAPTMGKVDYLKQVLSVFVGDDAQPWNANQFQAELSVHLFDKMDAWIAETYGLKPDHAVIRLSQVMKSVQSLLLLSFNPAYFINNELNNATTRAAEGMWGYMTPGQITQWMDRFGVSPARIDMGIGANESGTPYEGGKRAISQAREAKDALARASKFVNGIGNKVGLFSNLSAHVEAMESRQVTAIAMKRFWGKYWRKGKGLSTMPPQLEALLDSKYPGMKDMVYRAAEAGMNMEEVNKALFSGLVRPSVKAAIDTVSRSFTPDHPERLSDLMTHLGLDDELERRLARATTDDDVDAAFNWLEGDMQRRVNEMLARVVIGHAEDVRNKVTAERTPAVLSIFGDMEIDEARHWINLRHETDQHFAKKGQLPYDVWEDAYDALEVRQEQDWINHNQVQLQKCKGIIEALGISDSRGAGYVDAVSRFQALWREFFKIRKQKYIELRGSRKKAAAETWAQYSNRRSLSWDRFQKDMTDLYDDYAKREIAIQGEMDDMFGAMFKDFAGWDSKTAKAWRADVARIRAELVQMQKQQRQATANMDAVARDRAYIDFNQKYNAKIAEMKIAEQQGVFDAMTQPRPPKPEIAIPEPAPRPEAGADIRDSLTPEQRQQYDDLIAEGVPPETIRVDEQGQVSAPAPTPKPGTAVMDMARRYGIVDKNGNAVERYALNVINKRQAEGQKFANLADVPADVADAAFKAHQAAHASEGVKAQARRVIDAQEIVDMADASAREADLRAKGMMTRRAIRESLLNALDGDELAAEATLMLMDSHADVWARQRGWAAGENTRDAWYATHIARIINETEDGADPLPRLKQEIASERRSWYYSQLQRTISAKMPNKASKEQIRGMLQGQVKADELKWTGFDEWLDEQKGSVTKQQVMDFLQENQVEVQEVVRGTPRTESTNKLIRDLTQERDDAARESDKAQNDLDTAIKERGIPRFEFTDGGETVDQYLSRNGLTDLYQMSVEAENVKQAAQERLATFLENHPESEGTKYQGYILPGGQNYRELLLTLPERMREVLPDGYSLKKANGRIEIYDKSGQLKAYGSDQQDAFRMLNKASLSYESGVYQSGHWSEPNVLAHTRFDDRIDADGKRVLFIEEIQSDWHQAGREKGYKEVYKELPPEFEVVQEQGGYSVQYHGDGFTETISVGTTRDKTISDALEIINRKGLKGNEVPAAPFSKSWEELTIKRIIRWAAENGYERVAWTTGKMQADRYSLAKHVDKIDYVRGEGYVQLTGKKGGAQLFDQTLSPDELAANLGQDVARRIMEGPSVGTLEGPEDLTVGGEGMRAFYDEKIPNIVGKYIKKWGAKVGETKVVTQPAFYKNEPWHEMDIKETVQSFDVTPAMRESAMQGQPLFQRAKGSFELLDDGRAVIRAFNAADVSTMVHEIGHVFRRDLGDADMDAVAKLGGLKDAAEFRDLEDRFRGGSLKQGDADYSRYVQAEEGFARGWELYLAEGRAPTPQLKSVFRRFTNWMLGIYKNLRRFMGRTVGAENEPQLAGVNLNAQVNGISLRDVFDRLLTDEKSRPQDFAAMVEQRALDLRQDIANHRQSSEALAGQAERELAQQVLAGMKSIEEAKTWADQIDADQGEIVLDNGIVADSATVWDAIAAVEKRPETAPWAEVAQVRGTKTTARGLINTDTVYEFRFKVIDIADVHTSDLWSGDSMVPNPAYPQELQPRNRTQKQSIAFVDRDIASKLHPDQYLKDGFDIDRGAPIVGPDNYVESGNGRVLAVQRAIDRYPDKYADYRAELDVYAAQYGIDPASYAGMEHPVLVRERITEVDRAAFARDANDQSSQTFTPAEVAMNDAARISDQSLANLNILETETIQGALQAARNNDFVHSWISQLSPTEVGALSRDGVLNSKGLDRLANALFAKTYQGAAGERLLDAFTATNEPGIKSIEQAMTASLPQVARMEGMIAAGVRDPGLSIAEDVSVAVDKLAYLRRSARMTVTDYLNQTSAFGDDLTPTQRRLLEFFAPQKAPKRVREFLRDYALQVTEHEPNPNQMGLFGDVESHTKEQILDMAMKDAEPEGGLFAAQPEPTAAATPEPAAAVPTDELARPQPGGSEVRGGTEAGVIAQQALAAEALTDFEQGRPVELDALQRAELPAVEKPAPARVTFQLDRGAAADIENLTQRALDNGGKVVIVRDVSDNPDINAFNQGYSRILTLTPAEFAAAKLKGDYLTINASGEAITPTGETIWLYADAKAARTQAQALIDAGESVGGIDFAPDHIQAQGVQVVKVKPFAYGDATIIGKVYQNGQPVAYLPTDLDAQGFDTQGGQARLLGLDLADARLWVYEVGGRVQSLDPANPTLRGQNPQLFQDGDAVGDVALGGTPTLQDQGMALNEINQEFLRPAMRRLREDYKTRLGEQAFNVKNMEASDQKAVRGYLNQVKADMAGAKLATMNYGTQMRDAALLNYSRRFGADNIANMIMPYEFWYTRTLMNWGKRMIDRPAWFAAYARYRQAQERMERDGMPSRMRGKVRLPMPWMPEWMGGGLWVDPLRQFFPPSSFFSPMEQFSNNQTRLDATAQAILKEMQTSGDISQAELQDALDNRAGPVWEQALKQAEIDENQDSSPAGLVTTMMSPALWWSIPAALLKGKPETISTLPITRTAQSVETALEGTPLDTIGKAVGLVAKPEELIRKAAGLSEFGQWGEYYVERQLANMAADGTVTPQQAKIAMIEKGENPAYQQAYGRVRQEMMLRTPGALALQRLLNGDLKGAGQSLPQLFFSGGLFPEGELRLRGLKPEYNNAWAKYEAGDAEAINDFFTAHPEYEARLALYDEPEERLKQFLVSEVWDRYLSLSKANRSKAVRELGTDFTNSFLEQDTSNYDALSIDTLARWSWILNGAVPKVTETETLTQPEPMQPYPDAVSQAVADFNIARDQLYPDVVSLQNIYYALPENQRRQYLATVPRLKRYWEWKRGWQDQHPEIMPYVEDMKATLDDDQIGEMNAPLLRQLIAYYLGGESLSGGAKSDLRRIWEASGQPTGDFENWMETVVRATFENQ